MSTGHGWGSFCCSSGGFNVPAPSQYTSNPPSKMSVRKQPDVSQPNHPNLLNMTKAGGAVLRPTPPHHPTPATSTGWLNRPQSQTLFMSHAVTKSTPIHLFGQNDMNVSCTSMSENFAWLTVFFLLDGIQQNPSWSPGALSTCPVYFLRNDQRHLHLQ